MSYYDEEQAVAYVDEEYYTEEVPGPESMQDYFDELDTMCYNEQYYEEYFCEVDEDGNHYLNIDVVERRDKAAEFDQDC